MYSVINDPFNGESHNINSREGIEILKNYITNLTNQIGSSGTKYRSQRKPPPAKYKITGNITLSDASKNLRISKLMNKNSAIDETNARELLEKSGWKIKRALNLYKNTSIISSSSSTTTVSSLESKTKKKKIIKRKKTGKKTSKKTSKKTQLTSANKTSKSGQTPTQPSDHTSNLSNQEPTKQSDHAIGHDDDQDLEPTISRDVDFGTITPEFARLYQKYNNSSARNTDRLFLASSGNKYGYAQYETGGAGDCFYHSFNAALELLYQHDPGFLQGNPLLHDWLATFNSNPNYAKKLRNGLHMRRMGCIRALSGVGDTLMNNGKFVYKRVIKDLQMGRDWEQLWSPALIIRKLLGQKSWQNEFLQTVKMPTSKYLRKIRAIPDIDLDSKEFLELLISNESYTIKERTICIANCDDPNEEKRVRIQQPEIENTETGVTFKINKYDWQYQTDDSGNRIPNVSGIGFRQEAVKTLRNYTLSNTVIEVLKNAWRDQIVHEGNHNQGMHSDFAKLQNLLRIGIINIDTQVGHHPKVYCSAFDEDFKYYILISAVPGHYQVGAIVDKDSNKNYGVIHCSQVTDVMCNMFNVVFKCGNDPINPSRKFCRIDCN